MALVDLTKILCNSAGTGPFVLGANVPGYFGVEQLTDGSTYGYSVQRADGTKEYGRGTYSGGALSRNVIQSSAGTAPIAVMVGDKIAFAALAEDIATAGVGPNVMAISDLNTSANMLDYWTGIGTAALTPFTAFARNLAGASTSAIARSTLGLGTLATQSGTFSGMSSGTNTGDQTNIAGNAETATKLQTARTINGVEFDGSDDITLPGSDTIVFTPGGPTGAAGQAAIAANLLLGNAPAGSYYELNVGGQGVVTPGMIQIINIAENPGYQSSLIEAAQYSDDGKPVVINVTKSRGNGIIGDPHMNRPGVGGDRLFVFAINCGGYYDGYDHPDQPRAGASGGHAGYATWTLENDTKTTAGGPNSVDAMFHIVGSSANELYLGQGGVQGNCLAQVYFSGANQAQHNARDRYRGLVEIGAGTGVAEKYQPLAFNSAPLIDPTTDPTRLFDGGLEYYSGNLYFTHASDGAGTINRRVMLTAAPMALGAVPTNAAWTATVAMGPDWARLTVTVGNADITPLGIGFGGRINFATPLPAVPVVVGSFFTDASVPIDAAFQYLATQARVTCVLIAGTMKANQVYTFSVIIRQP